ncbi:hypothetical protein BT93_I0987 [Corymbia citriodora subsp. variegata]|nr:hypothetical protein BT93_I0987 [Corymbia citriodora subsp. variegata]
MEYHNRLHSNANLAWTGLLSWPKIEGWGKFKEFTAQAHLNKLAKVGHRSFATTPTRRQIAGQSPSTDLKPNQLLLSSCLPLLLHSSSLYSFWFRSSWPHQLLVDCGAPPLSTASAVTVC